MISQKDFEFLVSIAETKNLPWFKYNKKEKKLVLVVDNHLLSTYRACASAYMIQHVDGYHKKQAYGLSADRRWFLDFGIVFHEMMRIYYKNFREGSFCSLDWATDQAWEEWTKMNLDIYKIHPEYQLIGGIKGFTGLLLQYAHKFTAENEKLRILGTEISFGKNKEIALLRSKFLDIFLAGRMDVIVDDGFFIMPMDHKTTKNFSKDPLHYYEMDEGPTGYIYSLKQLLPQLVSEEYITKRDCSRILMNIISKSVPASNPMDRFKRLPIWKTEQQLSAYRERQVSTCYALLGDLIRHFKNQSVKRDTSHCTNWFMGECPYYDVHRQSDKFGEEATLRNGYVKLPLWDTEAISLNGA